MALRARRIAAAVPILLEETMPKDARSRGSCLGRLLKVALLAGALVTAALLVWAFLNEPPSADPVVRDRLSTREVAILRESQALRRAQADELWPGFGRASIPVQLYNDRFGFVVGMPAPRGWEEVPAERIDGQPYYRSGNPERQAFAVRIGETWVASITVKDAMDAESPRLLRAKIGPLARLVPYRLFIVSTEQYVTLLLHEQFHAFQAQANPRRFAAALTSYGPAATYPWDRGGYRTAWLEEVKLLQSALAQPDRTARRDLVRQFLRRREERRRRFTLDQPQLAFERQIEWLEGLGKYAELESWRLAASSGYQPLDALRGDAQFHGYSGYQGQWRTERMNMKIGMNLHGDLPFYYTGAMQAWLLDALRPGWKTGFLEGDRSLQDLLSDASAT
jgi:hypothetical protein